MDVSPNHGCETKIYIHDHELSPRTQRGSIIKNYVRENNPATPPELRFKTTIWLQCHLFVSKRCISTTTRLHKEKKTWINEHNASKISQGGSMTTV